MIAQAPVFHYPKSQHLRSFLPKLGEPLRRSVRLVGVRSNREGTVKLVGVRSNREGAVKLVGVARTWRVRRATKLQERKRLLRR